MSAVAYGEFLRGLISNPRGVSAPTPSSPTLSRIIAGQVDPSRQGLVVELGPGTGVVTRALLERGVAAHRLVLIEQTASFARLLSRRFSGVRIHHGDALDFERCLPPGAAIAAIVSGLPLLQFPLAERQSLLRRALACQGCGGRLVQLSYSWRPPVPPPAGMHLGKIAVWRNFPPAHVWTYTAP